MELQASIIVVVAAFSTGIYATRVVMSQETNYELGLDMFLTETRLAGVCLLP